ncbi:hypothetical protein [Bacteroides thetaiotaomicron]|uniref:hypothetical protein n=1 Tax=Bacteroides thetaiotaomicron TaxID=818 RepID=UPI003B4F327E|nr:hypothetical protein [Escherichia coli]
MSFRQNMAIAELSEQLHGRLGFSHTTEVGDNTTGELYPDLTRLYSATITGRVGSR